MGLTLSGFIIGIILLIIGLFMLKSKIDFLNDFLGILFLIIGSLITLFTSILLISMLYDYTIRNYDLANENFKRTKCIRMLNENYNAENLTNALDFNISQKRASNYNKSFLFLCWEHCYSTDTIVIPSTSYLPSNMVKIDAVIDKLNTKLNLPNTNTSSNNK